MYKTMDPRRTATELAKAVELHQEGRFDAAGRIYRAIIDADPDNADARHLFGLLHHQCGHHAEAVKWIGDAIKRHRTAPPYHSNLGEAHRALGDTAAAERCYRRALKLDPKFADALINLGTLQREQAQTDAAIASYRKALAVDANSLHGWFNLAATYADIAAWEACVEAFEKVVQLAPQLPDGHVGLGMALKETGNLERAAESLQAALARDLGMVNVWNNLGNIHAIGGRLAEAERCFRNGLKSAPDDIAILCNLADLKIAVGDLDAARETYNRVLKLDPENLLARTGLNNVEFFEGNWASAWDGYDLRFKSPEKKKRPFTLREWAGEPVEGKTVLVWGEQGVGEEIQFASMIPDLIDAGANVIVESDARLVPLFQRSFPAATCIARTDPPNPAMAALKTGYQCASGSLGRMLRRQSDDFPDRTAYLFADKDRVRDLRARYKRAGNGLSIGVAWHSKTPTFGKLKSLQLGELAPALSAFGDAVFVDLQYGDTAFERETLKRNTGITLLHDDEIDQLIDLDTFAVQVAALDLVISVSNSVAHVSGALGIPTWILLSAAPLNRWMLERADSPWYPSAKLFRQSKLGEWSDVIDAIAREIETFQGGK